MESAQSIADEATKQKIPLKNKCHVRKEKKEECEQNDSKQAQEFSLQFSLMRKKNPDTWVRPTISFKI